MRLLYRADGGHPIGTGHLYRAFRVISALRRIAIVSGAVLTGETATARAIGGSVPNAPLIIVPTRPSFGPDSIKPRFEYASIAELDCLEPAGWDLICVDMLDTDSEEMGRLAGYGVPIVTFDDRGNGRLSARGIINSLIVEPDPDSLPPLARLWDGFEYAVLDSAYRLSNNTYEFESGSAERVFVTLGGGDAAGLTVKVATALTQIAGIRRVEFGTGPAFPHREALSHVLRDAPWESEVFVSLPNLIDRYRSCDVAVVAGGLTMYEACCVGVPALAVCQPIDHQLELAGRLADAGAMATVGYGTEATEMEIAGAVRELLANEERRRALSENGPRLVDGRGVERVARALLEVANG